MLLYLKKTLYAGLALTLALAAFLLAPSAFAQTFRGQLSGIVLDTQGAAVAGAAVQLKNPSTDATIEGKSNHVGEFVFPELQPGIYSVKVSVPGFETAKVDDINVAVSTVATVKVVLAIGSENTVVDVQANGVQVDTDSSALVSVVDPKAVQDEPMNGRDFTKMIRFTAGVVGSGYANGNANINYQVDGVDNVDAWLNIVASNQGGIAGVPGGLIPIEAIDQFSVQSQGEADMGRNAGANQNMVMKSGTNQIHGDVFFYNRNEFFAAIQPVAPVVSRKAPIRNNQFGFTLGGPIWKDHTFLFLAGEIQLASAGNSANATAINPAWLAIGKAFNQDYGLSGTQNAVTAAVYSPSGVAAGTNIFPDVVPTSTATVNNWFATAPNQYNSFNGVIKLDHHFSEKEYTSARYIGTTGKQTAYTSSYYSQFFQTAPMHIHNGSLIHTSILSPRLLNQLTLGINYFLQTFNDANQNYSPAVKDGINVGATGIIAAGAPTISITGFQGVGATQPSGRTDVTGQINDSVRYTLGKHSLKLGAEYRHTNVNSLGLGSSRGSFSFNGTGGPWSSTSVAFTPQVNQGCVAIATANGDKTLVASNGKFTTTQYQQCAAIYCYQLGGAAYLTGNLASGYNAATAHGQTCLSNVLSVADFFLGQTGSSVTGSSLRVGNGSRIYLLDQEDFWLHDDFKVTQKLSVNYGIRYSIPGYLHDAQNDLTSWTPQGFVTPIYHEYYKAIAPRFGFAYNPFPNSKTVLRGAWGHIYDVPSMNTMAASSAGNPAGPDPSYVSSIGTFNFQSGVNPFRASAAGTAPPATLPGKGVNPNYRIAYQENFSLGIEQELAKSTRLDIGYSGAEGRRLPVTYDLNQATSYTPTGGVYHRPYDAAGTSGLIFPGQTVASGAAFAALTQLTSAGISNFNSLNVSIRQSNWKGITANINYIWSHKLDDGTAPTDNYNNSSTCTNCVNGAFPNGISGPGIKMDYGNGAGDTRHTFDGFVSYSLPKFHFVPKLSQGWQVNSLFSFYTGAPLSPGIGVDYSFTSETTAQRPNIVPGVSAYLPKQTITNATTGARTYQTINRAAFDYPCGATTPCNLASNPNACTTGLTGTANTSGCFGVYGNMRKGQIYGTAFGDVDFSLFKYTAITEKVKSEFRVEVFNIFNQSNLANPGVTLTSSTFGQATATRQNSSNPGMGYGEPFNVQFALKLLF